MKPVELVSEARWRQSELHRFPKPDNHFFFDNDNGDDDEHETKCDKDVAFPNRKSHFL